MSYADTISKRLTIAITGGIGSGKTTVIQWLKQQGFYTINADEIARDVVQPNTVGINKITERFGNEILHKDGTLNRKRLRGIVFKNCEDKIWLEGLLHPLIHEKIQQKINNSNHENIIFIEIPLLVEIGKPEYIDQVWLVDCSEKTQCQRVFQRNQHTKSEIMEIIQQQAQRAMRLALADFVIDTEQPLKKTYLDLKDKISKM